MIQQSGALLLMATGFQFNLVAQETEPVRPNIVLIYADDLGYGDISLNGAERVQTPHIDRIGQEGINFGNAHAAAATCTPSRYSLLTGEFLFRQFPDLRALPGDAALIIDTEQVTLSSMLKQAGYRTGIVGKWHLGLGDGEEPIDWNAEIAPGPRELGFDYSFLIPATGDRVPTVYTENRHVVGLDPDEPPLVVRYGPPPQDGFGQPTAVSHPELLTLHPIEGHTFHNGTIVNGISRIGYMEGGYSARWSDEDMADTLTERAVRFIEEDPDEPFFLFFSLHDPHTPRVPHERFRGATDMGVRGDVIVQIDWCVGEILRTLEAHGICDNTLVIFTSDNGPVVTDAYDDGAAELLGDHQMAGPYRGTKYHIWEGGTRVPTLMRWPAQIEPGQHSHALVSQIDFLASFAYMVGVELQEGDAIDSENVLPALLGRTPQSGRNALVKHAFRRYSLLTPEGWKYIRDERAGQPPEALYYLVDDIREEYSRVQEEPERLATLRDELDRIKARGREDEEGSKLMKLGAEVIEVSSQHHQHPASYMIDGDPGTFWHTNWQPSPDPLPHHLVIDLGREVDLEGLTYLPRQDMRAGRWAECEVFAGSRPYDWGTAVATATLEDSAEWQTIPFQQSVTARYLKVKINSEVRPNGQAASAAEVDVILVSSENGE